MNVNMMDYLIPKEIYDELFSDYLELVQKEEQLQQENARLKEKNKKAIDKLEFYNSGEALWYVPIQEIINILKEN